MATEFANGIHPDPVELGVLELMCRSDNKEIGQLKTLIHSIISCPSTPRKLAVPLFRNIYKSRPAEQLDVDIDHCDEFIDQLRACSEAKLLAKDANLLVNTTEFDPSLSKETDRGLDNVKKVWGVWLDLDGGVVHGGAAIRQGRRPGQRRRAAADP